MKPIWNRIKDLVKFLKETYLEWSRNEPYRNSAIITYYTIFSLPGLLVVIINLTGYFIGQERATNFLSEEASDLIGPETAWQIDQIIHNTPSGVDFTVASIMGVFGLLYGATGLFYHTKKTLNNIWGVQTKPKRAWLKIIMDRLFSLVMVALVGVFILSLLLVSVVLGAFSDWLTANLAFGLTLMFPILDLVFSLALITVLIAAIFRLLPDINPPMRDVWPGAFVTALLFAIAKFALGYYLGHSDQGSAYGTAGSIILIMVWTSFSGLILIYGTAFIKVSAQWKGHMGQGTINFP